MRDYDSLAHRHCSQDMCVEPPMSLIANLIGFVPAEEDLHYALGFYAEAAALTTAWLCAAESISRIGPMWSADCA